MFYLFESLAVLEELGAGLDGCKLIIINVTFLAYVLVSLFFIKVLQSCRGACCAFARQGTCHIFACLKSITVFFNFRNLASILVESGVTGHCCSIRGLCGNPKEWRVGSVPFVSLMRLVPNVQDNPTLSAETIRTGIHPGEGSDRASRTPSVTEQPVIPSSEVSLEGKGYR